MNILDTLIKLCDKAEKNGDIPVSCIIVYNNKIISKAYNTKYSKNNPLGHAEINAIIKATKKLKTVNLMDCTMYVTLKPCDLCQNLIKECRIKKVYYFLENDKRINSNTKYIKLEDNEYLKQKITNFFKNKRCK